MLVDIYGCVKAALELPMRERILIIWREPSPIRRDTEITTEIREGEASLDPELYIGWVTINGLSAQPITMSDCFRNSGPWDLHQPWSQAVAGIWALYLVAGTGTGGGLSNL